MVYDVVWCPHNDSLFASCSEDRTLLLWDQKPSNQINQSQGSTGSNGAAILAIPGLQHEILSCYFIKYDKNLIATGSCDTSIKLWDLRKIEKPFCILTGHKYAIRRIKFSPHHPTMLMSVGYDMSAIFWDYMAGTNPMLSRYDQHSEFVVGCGFNLFIENLVATAGWDEKCYVFVNQYNKINQQLQQSQMTINNKININNMNQPK